MELEAVREYINQSPFRDWYGERNVTLNLPYQRLEFSLKGAVVMFEYANTQLNLWNSYTDKLPEVLKRNKDYFKRLKEQIESLFSNINDLNDLKRKWNLTHEFFVNTINTEKPFVFDHPITGFLIILNNESEQEFLGAYRYFFNDARNALNNTLGTKGYFKALIFETKPGLNSEDIEFFSNHIKELRNSSSEYLSNFENHLSSYIKRTNDEYNTLSNQLTEENSKLTNEFKDWTNTSIENFNTFNEASQQKIKDLEEAYGEKLRLSEPIKYWKERALILKKNTNRNFAILGIFLFISAASIYFLLWFTPKDMLENLFNGDKSAAIRWSIVFIIFISIVFYGIRMLMKITLSSLHLARDAEERERLTYVYLALIKDSAMDKEDRQMVMQSLFSRAETGLLKDDSGPTMPGIIIDKLK